MTEGSSFILKQSRRALFRAITAESAAILLVVHGDKTVRLPETILNLHEGMLAILPPRTPMTIENFPASDGPYSARGIPVSDVDLASMQSSANTTNNTSVTSTNRKTIEAFLRAADHLDDGLTSPSLRSHLVREVLLRLSEDGCCIGAPPPLSFLDKLRTLLSTDLSQDWTAVSVAPLLAVSEATLRRRLAAKNVSFREILIDARMTAGLGLLQTTDFSIARIAAEVGYTSASRFAIRFRDRFDVSPSEIRKGVATNRLHVHINQQAKH